MNLFIDRIELTLDGVSPGDARLLSAELPAALETRLGAAPGGGDNANDRDDSPLETALRGRVLVQAIAARLAEAIQVERRRAEHESTAQTSSHGAGAATTHRDEETSWL